MLAKALILYNFDSFIDLNDFMNPYELKYYTMT